MDVASDVTVCVCSEVNCTSIEEQRVGSSLNVINRTSTKVHGSSHGSAFRWGGTLLAWKLSCTSVRDPIASACAEKCGSFHESGGSFHRSVDGRFHERFHGSIRNFPSVHGASFYVPWNQNPLLWERLSRSKRKTIMQETGFEEPVANALLIDKYQFVPLRNMI